uniref:hypothetical protein n=1 Tax=Gemmiger formicilis TaxID=745368 RepID=UPI0040250CE9
NIQNGKQNHAHPGKPAGKGRADRRNTAFPKCRLPKGDAEPQVIIFIKMQKKTLNSTNAGVY